MTDDRRLILAFLFITLILLLRDTPYLNVLIIDKLWIVYVLVVAIIAFFFIPRKEGYLITALFFFLFLALILILTGITFAAEVIGIIIYILLWFIVIQKIIYLVRSEKRNNP